MADLATRVRVNAQLGGVREHAKETRAGRWCETEMPANAPSKDYCRNLLEVKIFRVLGTFGVHPPPLRGRVSYAW